MPPKSKRGKTTASTPVSAPVSVSSPSPAPVPTPASASSHASTSASTTEHKNVVEEEEGDGEGEARKILAIMTIPKRLYLNNRGNPEDIFENPVFAQMENFITRKRAFFGRMSKAENGDSDTHAVKKLRASDKTSFLCNHCLKKFDRASALEVHTRTHLGERPFICSIEGCGKAFVRREHMQNHLCSHFNLRRYACTFESCGKHFITSSQLSRHVITQHQSQNYQCESCGQFFKRVSELREHNKLSHSVYVFQCKEDNCRKTFPSASKLKRHMESHCRVVEPWRCLAVTCKEQFTKKSERDKHMRTSSDSQNEENVSSVVSSPIPASRYVAEPLVEISSSKQTPTDDDWNAIFGYKKRS